MQKEKLTLLNITEDLKITANYRVSNSKKWRLAYVIPSLWIAATVLLFLKDFLVAIFFFLLATYHTVRYVLEYREYNFRKKWNMNVLRRDEISISIEKLSHISEEIIYEPHRFATRSRITKTVNYFYFSSGKRWRLPIVDMHYKWSKDYYVSTAGLKNISIEGDEFFYVCLQSNPDIAYVYPCKNFMLDDNLNF